MTMYAIGCAMALDVKMKTATISVRTSEAVKKAAIKAAKNDNRSVASLVEKILQEWLRDKGYLK